MSSTAATVPARPSPAVTTAFPSIADVQGSPDLRRLDIDRVGIRGVRHPIQVRCADGSAQATVAVAAMYVRLPHQHKGTHMSRFIDLLGSHAVPLDADAMLGLMRDMLDRLEAQAGHIELRFPFFVSKHAPVTGVPSLLDYDVCLTADMTDGRLCTRTEVVVPVTTLCPCSKKISDYGAHNQRSHITLNVETDAAAAPVTLEELIAVAEAEASCEVFGLLKRPDEKYVTERAYDNPKFVEDLVRDLAGRLNEDARIVAYRVESENFESIHNHSAYACIVHDRRVSVE